MTSCEDKVTAGKAVERLSGHVRALAEMTELMGDDNSTRTLRHLEPRLGQGLVRTAFVGVTSTGKSTAINALIGELALPENPSVSSPIPVWIGYRDEKASQAEIYLTEDGKFKRKTCDLNTFKREYCYNIEDIANRDRSRYNSVEFGAVKTCSRLLEGGLTLIDTLGIAATTVDSRKTIRVLREGVDAVVFVTKSANLNLDEKRFLYRYVLGCRNAQTRSSDSGDIEPFRAVSPENLFFVYNDWYGVPAKAPFIESVCALYRNSDLGMDEAEIRRLAEENVFFINAYRGRLGLLGEYPYVDCAPAGSGEEAVSSLRELEEFEREELEGFDRAELVETSGIPELAEAIKRKAYKLCFGRNSVAVRRIRELVPVIDGVMNAADKRVGDINLSMAELERRRENFAALREDDAEEQAGITTALMALNQKYRQSFTRLLEDITPDLITDCAGNALRTAMPLDFRSRFRDYLSMDVEGREQFLRSMLPEQIKSTYEYCTGQLLKALDERRTDDYQTPFAVMEEVRLFIANQANLLNTRVESLRNMGAANLGASLPESVIVDEIFRQLELDLEEKVKEIIADSCMMSGRRFEESIRRYVSKCKLGIITKFFPQAADWLWNKITKNLFAPMAEAVVNGMSDYTSSNIFLETTAAFDMTKTKICMSHIKLFVSLEVTLSELEERLRAKSGERTQESEKAAELKRKCEEIKSDILYMQSSLQNG